MNWSTVVELLPPSYFVSVVDEHRPTGNVLQPCVKCDRPLPSALLLLPPPPLDFPLKFCLLYEGIRRKLKPKMKLSATYSPIYLTGVLPQLITINIFHFCFFCFCCMHFCKKKLIIIKMISCNVEVIWSVIDCWPCIMQESQNIHN